MNLLQGSKGIERDTDGGAELIGRAVQSGTAELQACIDDAACDPHE